MPIIDKETWEAGEFAGMGYANYFEYLASINNKREPLIKFYMAGKQNGLSKQLKEYMVERIKMEIYSAKVDNSVFGISNFDRIIKKFESFLNELNPTENGK